MRVMITGLFLLLLGASMTSAVPFEDISFNFLDPASDYTDVDALRKVMQTGYAAFIFRVK